MILLPGVLVGSAPWILRLAVAAAWIVPWPTLVVVAILIMRARRNGTPPGVGAEASALLEVRAALHAGQTLREALAGMSPELDRLVTVGATTERLAVGVVAALGDQGPLAGAAVRLLDRVGGPAAPVIEELATQATETVRIRRELRAAVAAPVLQGTIVGGAPLAVLVVLVLTGGFTTTFSSSPAHALTVSAGAVLTVVGAVWVVLIVRRALP